MAYSTDDDLLKEFSLAELSKLSGSNINNEINSERTEYARSMADSMIDTYLSGKYALPIENPDAIINKISIDLTVANLFEYAYQKTGIPSSVTWRKLNAVKLLKDIAQGSLKINNAGIAEGPPFIISNKTESDRTFSEDVLDAFFE